MREFRLFAHGERFDVDAFLASTTLRPDRVWRRGDQRRYACVESRHETSGLELAIGDERAIALPEQERIAITYLTTYRDELRTLADFSGVDTFILGLEYRTAFERNVIGFCLAPSLELMRQCLDVGCVPVYYVTLDRRPERDIGAVDSEP